MADGLNPAQHAAVKTLTGPLLVLAGAGTGKTRVVTYRIAELIKHGTRPSRILAVTFTNKAATEMQERAAALLGKRLPEKPEISTFHSLCVRILRRHAPQLGYPAKFAIYDRGDQESVARGALREIRVPDESLRPGDLINFISRWKTHRCGPTKRPAWRRATRNTWRQWPIAAIRKRSSRPAPSTSTICCCVTEELFAHHAEVRQAEAARFTHLLIDEYQDTNASQYRIVRALADGHRNLCVVGDDDQSIYGWRGAEVAHISAVQARLARGQSRAAGGKLPLDRSDPDAGQPADRFNKMRHDKVLRPARLGGERPQILQCQDEEAEAKMVVDDIRARLADGRAQPRDFAILFRTNEQPRVFETELRKAKLPYVLVGGMSFYDRKEVRDVLAYLKLLVSPNDEVSLRRIINTPPRGIGSKAQEALVERAVASGKPLWEMLARAGAD